MHHAAVYTGPRWNFRQTARRTSFGVCGAQIRPYTTGKHIALVCEPKKHHPHSRDSSTRGERRSAEAAGASGGRVYWSPMDPSANGEADFFRGLPGARRLKSSMARLVPGPDFCPITTFWAAHAPGVRRRRTSEATGGAPRGPLTGETDRSGQGRPHTDFSGVEATQKIDHLGLCHEVCLKLGENHMQVKMCV